MADYSPDTDPRSSNSLIRAYLASKQMQPGNPNYAQAVRTALSANAANPGLIPGLVNSTPSTEADDQAAMAAARHGIGGNSRGAGLPIPPIPPGAPPPGGGGGGGGDTSAPPPSGGGGPSDDEISSALLASAIASGGGAGALLMKRALGNRKPATPAVPHVAGVEGPGGQFELPLEGGKGAAPPRQGELPLQGGGPRVNQPELPLLVEVDRNRVTCLVLVLLLLLLLLFLQHRLLVLAVTFRSMHRASLSMVEVRSTCASYTDHCAYRTTDHVSRTVHCCKSWCVYSCS
jgi:hypothetical protein